VLVGDDPKPPDDVDEQLEHPERLLQQRVRRVAEPEEARVLLRLDALHGELVQPPDHNRELEAISEDLLPVADLVGAAEAEQQPALRTLVEVRVAGGDRVEERVELEVLLEVAGVRRERPLEIEVAIRIEQVQSGRTDRRARLISSANARTAAFVAADSRSRKTSCRYVTASTSRLVAWKKGFRSYSSRPAVIAATTWSRFRSWNAAGSSSTAGVSRRPPTRTLVNSSVRDEISVNCFHRFVVGRSHQPRGAVEAGLIACGQSSGGDATSAG
jgi:hypothetical protein